MRLRFSFFVLRPLTQPPRLFVQLCVMAGCDYVGSLPTVGVVKALDLVVKWRSVNADIRIDKICRFLAGKGVKIPEGYVAKGLLLLLLLRTPRSAAAAAATATTTHPTTPATP